MIGGYELLALNQRMNELVGTKEDMEAYIGLLVGTEKEDMENTIQEIDLEMERTLLEIENYGGAYEFN